MARLPDQTVLGGVPSLRSGRAVADISAGATALGKAVTAGTDALGDGLESLGKAISRKEEEDGRLEVAQANAEWLTRRIELDQRFDEDQDYATRKQRYEAELGTITQEVRGRISNQKYQQRFDIRTQPWGAAAIAAQEDRGRQQYHQAEVAHTLESGDKFIDQAIKTDDREQRALIIDTHAAQINALVEKRIITPERGRAMQRDFAKRYAQSDYLAAVNSGDPVRIETALNDLRSQPGTTDDVVNRIIRVEGTGRNRASSATGTGQFIDSTWLDMIRKHRPELADGKSDAEILELRADRRLGREMVARYAEQNNAFLKRQGIEITPGATYLAHFLGPKGAAAVLKASDAGKGGRAVQDVLAEAVGPDKARQMVAANPTILAGKQADTVVAWADRKMGGSDQGSIYRLLPAPEREQLLAQGEAARQRQQTTDIATFRTRIQDSEQESLRTGAVTNEIPRAEFIANMGHEAGTRAHAAYQGNIQLGRDLATLANLSPEQTSELLQKYEPQAGAPGFADQATRQDRLVRAAARIAEEKNKDPGAFAVTRLPAVAQAYGNFTAIVAAPDATPEQRQTAARVFAEITLAEQARIGIPESNRRIVPKNYVDELNARINQPSEAGGAGNVAQRLQAEAALWGDKWPLVYRDLQKQTTPIVRVIGSGVTPYAARVLVETNGISIGKLLDDVEEGPKVRAIKTEVAKAFAPLRQSLAGNEGEQAVFNDFQGMGEKLAAHYVRQGKSDTEAATLAFNDLIGHKYDFVENVRPGIMGYLFGGPSYRVPKGISKENVALGAENARRSLDQFQLAVPVDDIGGVSEANRKAASVSAYRRDGIWVTAPGDTGLMLVYRDQAVRKADGSPLVITWEGLEGMAKADPNNLDRPFFPDGGSAAGQLFRSQPRQDRSELSQPETQQAGRDLTERLRERFGSPPPALRFFAETVAGDRSKITEQRFSSQELDVLRDAAERGLSKGQKVIGYGDYAQGYEKNFRDINAGGTERALDALTDLPSSLAYTLGMARIRKEPDGTIVITDKYDFAASQKKVADLKAKGTWAVLKMAVEAAAHEGLLGVGNLVGNLATPEGAGRDVEIRIPPKRAKA